MITYVDSHVCVVSGHSLRVTAGVANQRDREGRTSPKQRTLLLIQSDMAADDGLKANRNLRNI